MTELGLHRQFKKGLFEMRLYFSDRVSLCSPGLEYNYVAQASLELMVILLCQPLKCWDYRGVWLPHLVSFTFQGKLTSVVLHIELSGFGFGLGIDWHVQVS